MPTKAPKKRPSPEWKPKSLAAFKCKKCGRQIYEAFRIDHERFLCTNP